jgi:YHS domain-containing protein
MLLDAQQAPAKPEDAGETLYFCSRGCRNQYEQEGGPIVLPTRAEANTPCGYTGPS